MIFPGTQKGSGSGEDNLNPLLPKPFAFQGFFNRKKIKVRNHLYQRLRTFVKQSRTLVLFVPQDALHGGPLPDGLFSGSRDALLRQHGGNGIGGFPLKELAVDQRYIVE